MISKKLSEIGLEDLNHLVEDNVQERKTLEYKSALPDNSDGDKKEFLADISSLANTQGGDLIFGLREENGVLQSDIGIAISNADAEIARLENMARDGIFPRIGLEIRAIDTGNGKKVIIARSKASLEAPHRVIFKGHDKFYKRNSNGKYTMDVGELRASFLQAGEIAERIRRFRTTRISDIKAGDGPCPLRQNESFIAIHIVPLSAFSTSFRLSSATLGAIRNNQYVSTFKPPFQPHGFSYRINLDGIVTYSSYDDPIVSKYTQLYSDGRMEAVETSILHWNASDANSNVRRRMPMYSVEGETMNCVKQYLQLLTALEFQPPFYVFLSLVGTEGLTVSAPTGHIDFHYENITQKELLLPEVVIENTTDNLEHKFRPIFDMIWNAAGVSNSLNFDDNNNFKPHA